MGDFLNSVQSNKIIGPLRSGFAAKKWSAQYIQLKSDVDDDRVFEAGNLIHKKLNNIRALLRFVVSDRLKSTTKVRVLAALVNYNFCIVAKKSRNAMEEFVVKKKGENPSVIPMSHDIAAVKMKILNGVEYAPDELIQSMVDGVGIPLKVILDKNPAMTGNPEFGKVEWEDVLYDFNLGILYSHVEDLWDDCLWNGYVAIEGDGLIRFLPKRSSEQIANVVGRARYNSLGREFALHSINLMRGEVGYGYFDAGKSMAVKSIAKEGRRQIIRLQVVDAGSAEERWLFILRLYASEPYYAGLINEPQPMLLGATLNHVLLAWTLLSKSSSLLRSDVENMKLSEDALLEKSLPYYAPVLYEDALRRMFSDGCGISFSQSQKLTEFFVFRGKTDQELWAQPLIPSGGSTYIPIFAATTSPNLRRLVDVWLNQLGVDLALRGPAFESHIRAAINTDIATSPLLRNAASCFQGGVNFTPSNGRSEEIDLVVVIGNKVIIGEAKCFLEPTEAKQIAMHRMKVVDAAGQARRKSLAVEGNKVEFSRRMKQLGFNLPEDFDVLAAVVLNSAIHSGIPMEGVPVVDEYIFHVFFKGEFVEMAVQEAGKGLQTVKKKIIYRTPDEAAATIEDFLKSPPQMKPLFAGISKRWVPVHAVGESDWVGAYMAYDCVPQLESIDGAIDV